MSDSDNGEPLDGTCIYCDAPRNEPHSGGCPTRDHPAPAALPLEELPEKRGSAPNTGVHPAPMSMPVPALDRAPPQELRELLQALRDAIRDSGASNDVRLYARFARLVADAFEALLAERDRLREKSFVELTDPKTGNKLPAPVRLVFDAMVKEIAALRLGRDAAVAENAEAREILLEGKPDCADDTLPSLLRLAVGSFRTQLAELRKDALTREGICDHTGLECKCPDPDHEFRLRSTESSLRAPVK